MAAAGAAPLVRIRVERVADVADVADPAAPDWLNDLERARLARMGSALRRAQFLAGHRLARVMAAERSGHAAGDWNLLADADGAPLLRLRSGAAATLHVSLAHSGEWVACAVADTPVGLDVEAETRARDLDALAAYTFAPEHVARLRALDGVGKAEAFYRFWTLAEAHGKHAGHGLRPHDVRRLAWRECAPADAGGRTWQANEMTLGAWCAPAARVELSGWTAPAPRYWRVEPASGAAG
jgi:4'-phosphopantetheinyl transferase